MSGIDLRTVMDMCGWRTPRMVQKYAAITADHMAEPIRKIA